MTISLNKIGGMLSVPVSIQSAIVKVISQNYYTKQEIDDIEQVKAEAIVDLEERKQDK